MFVGAILNIASQSLVERLLWTPVTIVLVLAFRQAGSAAERIVGSAPAASASRGYLRLINSVGYRVDHVVDTSDELNVPAVLLRPDGHVVWGGED
jgi:hypothetical protein